LLKVDIRWTRPNSASQEQCIVVGNVGGGRIATYRIQVIGVGRSMAPVEIQNYPRWSEPLSGFVARALHVAQSGMDQGQREDDPIADFDCVTTLVPGGVGRPQPLAQLTGRRNSHRYDARWQEADIPSTRRSFRTEERMPVLLLIRTLCRVTWRLNELPPVPPPIAVPVHTHEGLRYVREADIPTWVAPAFGKRSLGQQRPVIPGESSPCIYAWDWERFLG